MTITNTSVRSRQVQSKKGFTLTEIAIVLGIIGLILGAIWVAAAGVYSNQRVARANTAIMSIAQGVRSLFSTSASTGVAGNMNVALINAGVIPADLVLNAGVGTVNNPWAGGTTAVIAPVTMDSFTVQMTAVPRTACISLISGVAGSARDQGLFAVASTTASAPVTAAVAGTALATLPGQVAIVTPAIATTACSNANSNTVQFGFSLK